MAANDKDGERLGEILRNIDSVRVLNNEEIRQLNEQTLNPKKEDQVTQYTIVFMTGCLVVYIFVFFGYKLYRSLTEKERKREEKAKAKQAKKKK